MFRGLTFINLLLPCPVYCSRESFPPLQPCAAQHQTCPEDGSSGAGHSGLLALAVTALQARGGGKANNQNEGKNFSSQKVTTKEDPMKSFLLSKRESARGKFKVKFLIQISKMRFFFNKTFHNSIYLAVWLPHRSHRSALN